MSKIKYFPSTTVKERVEEIVNALGWRHVNTDRVFCFKSRGSKSKYVKARCYGFPRVWQRALDQEPSYVIEVLGDYYDGLCTEHQTKLLIHELLHIPSTFSGALRNHKGCFRKEQVTQGIVEKYYQKLIHGEELVIEPRKPEPSISYSPAVTIKKRVSKIVNALNWTHIDIDRVYCFESKGTKSNRLHARCWGLPIIWQQALGLNGRYVIEVLAENFYELSKPAQDKLLINELLYIPKNFSGSIINKRKTF